MIRMHDELGNEKIRVLQTLHMVDQHFISEKKAKCKWLPEVLQIAKESKAADEVKYTI